MIQLDLNAARKLMLAAQGLLHPPVRAARKADVLETIRRMGALQIDTIHVVARSPYLVLWSRLGDYDPRWLEELEAEGALFEYWAHAACFLPIEDYPYFRRVMLDGLPGWRDAPAWLAENGELANRILTHVRENGAVRSADFENPNHKGGGWWNWKEEKEALERLHTAGELMIARREKFQRVYDLRERILPGWEDTRTPSREEMRRALALKAVRALGVAAPEWVPDYFRLAKAGLPALLEGLAEEGLLVRASLHDHKADVYIHPENLSLAEEAAAGRLQSPVTTLLSPFDPLVWDRARARALFGFDYSIECYTPAAKRRYGYFTLPLLHGGELVGRLDPKAYRQEGVFEVKAVYLEPGVEISAGLLAGLANALRRCAAWHATPEVIVRRSDPPELAGLLGEALRD